MTSTRDRLFELLTDRALVGLAPREQIELAELLVKAQDVDIAAFDSAASAIALASMGALEPMPLALAAGIEKRAMKSVESRPASDFARTHELDKLSPSQVPTSFQRTQVDEIIEPEPAEYVSGDFKRTMEMDNRPDPQGAGPLSSPTLPRPNDPYVRGPVTGPHQLRAPANPTVPSRSSTPSSAAAPAAASVSPSGSAPVSAPVSAGHAVPPSLMRPSAPSRDFVSAPSATIIPFSQPRAPSRALAISGWIAAAACFLLAVGAFEMRRTSGPVATLPSPTAPVTPPTVNPVPTPAASPSPPSPAVLREQLLASTGMTRAEWASTKDPAGKATTGEVVWNKEQQKGVMRFNGLAKNDPSRAQYQLWIFDKTRDDKYPVDGGVFDVDSETGDVVVAIHATLPVNAPTLFAVTLEKPGGVVVSKRDRLVVTAKPAT